NLKHLINLKCGYEVSSDRLHERFTTLKRQPGPLADHLPQIESMLEDYYPAREWNRDGEIKFAKLKELKLKPL
ncbi:MAG: aldehyde ferredoxin oxidoreductase C-terminal domain-containing protein, partial [Anaerolineales bacterium]